MARRTGNNDRVICRFEDDLPSFILEETSSTISGGSFSLSQFEKYLEDCVDDDIQPLHYQQRADCAWLACRKPKRSLESVLGILEEQEEAQGAERVIHFKTLRPGKAHYYAKIHASNDESSHSTSCDLSCACEAPHNEWIRVDLESQNEEMHQQVNSPLSVEWVDLRASRKCNANGTAAALDSDKDAESWLPTTAASCTHFLRSLLDAKHSVSPWLPTKSSSSSSSSMSTQARDVVILIVDRGTAEAETLHEYRVSDACPSWFLHAVTFSKPPKNSPSECDQWIPTLQEGVAEEGLLFIYRRLPPRDRLSARHPITNEKAITGCLWETFYVYPTPDEEENANANATNGTAAHSCNDEPQTHYRQVSPPYINTLMEYPGLLDPLLLPENMAILQEECKKIPQWTAWPESEHYKVTSSNGDNGEDDGGGGGAPWNVFPLCHCFPADQVDKRQWIGPTCALVPRTVQLLKEHLGDALRTALFSRLDPGAVLEAHTGWQDLANHVLRVHLPLTVPQEKAGLAGLWVDGCVESHAVGRLVCFDDSKTHRAFNYSNQSRIVLILDLARQPTGIPLGTAVGGHSEELDKFIEQMNV